VIRKDGTSIQRYVRGDGSYLAANGPRVHFGLGKSLDARSATANVDRLQVRWPAGGCESWSQTTVDRIMNLREGTGQPCPAGR
jgi:hypothetical protein